MPAKGTKQVEVHGQTVFLAEEQAELEKLVGSGLDLQGKMAPLKEELDGVKLRLAEIAGKRRGVKATVNIVTSRGLCKVEWSKETSVDEQTAEALRKDLGQDWGEVFYVKPKYGLAKGFKAWCQSTGAAAAKLKARILGAISVKENNPSVKLVGPKTDGGADG